MAKKPNYPIFIRFEKGVSDELYRLLFQIGSWSKYGTKVVRGGAYVSLDKVIKYLKENTELSDEEYEVSNILLGRTHTRL